MACLAPEILMSDLHLSDCCSMACVDWLRSLKSATGALLDVFQSLLWHDCCFMIEKVDPLVSGLSVSVSWESYRYSLQTLGVLPLDSTCTSRDLACLSSYFNASSIKQSACLPLNLTSGRNLSELKSSRTASDTHSPCSPVLLSFQSQFGSVCTTPQGWWRSASL